MEVVPRERVEAVRAGIEQDFPGSQSDRPIVPENYFDGGPDVAVIRNDGHRLRISEECFDYHTDQEIIDALRRIDYSRHLAERRDVVLGCVPHRSRDDLECLETFDDWYLSAWSA